MMTSIHELMTADTIETFLLAIGVKQATRSAYQKAIRLFSTYCAANDISAPTEIDVSKWRSSLLSTLKPTSAYAYLAGVKRFFAWAASCSLWKDIAKPVKGVKIDRGFKKFCLTEQQARALLQNIAQDDIHGKRDYAIIALMLTTGVRDCEVMRANVKDLRATGCDSVLYVQGKGKDAKWDYVKLAPDVECAIRQWLTARGAQVDSGEPLFSSLSHRTHGQRLTTRSISRIAKSRLIAAGFESEFLTAHSLRHTAATLAIKAGMPLTSVSQMLRHASITTTMIYNHAIEREANNCELSIASKLFG